MIQFFLSAHRINIQMATQPVNISKEMPIGTPQVSNWPLRSHNTSLKRGPTIINPKKLPKDFFWRQGSTQSQSKDNQCRIHDLMQKGQMSGRKIISQNTLNLNEFGVNQMSQAQITSCFGFVQQKPITDNKHRTGASQCQNRSLQNNNDFKGKYRSENKPKNNFRSKNELNNAQCYLENLRDEDIDKRDQKESCSIELNYEDHICRHDDFIGEFQLNEKQRNVESNNVNPSEIIPLNLSNNRKDVLGCTFAIYKTEAVRKTKVSRQVNNTPFDSIQIPLGRDGKTYRSKGKTVHARRPVFLTQKQVQSKEIIKDKYNMVEQNQKNASKKSNLQNVIHTKLRPSKSTHMSATPGFGLVKDNQQKRLLPPISHRGH